MFLRVHQTLYLVRDFLSCADTSASTLEHAKEAVHWLERAQDATPDRGVSHSYVIGRGWLRSYPETTGYIIPTLFNWHRLTAKDGSRGRAIEMADWESAIQLENGAVMGSVLQEEPKPVVFNTGQVIFGWIAAYKETGERKYLDSAMRAADWLLSVLDEDFTWRKHGNMGADAIHSYNVRVVWAVLELAKLTGKSDHTNAMKGTVESVLNQEEGRGWFKHNCLTDNKNPLLHTIAYTARGLLEAGLILNHHRAVDAAVRTSKELIGCVGQDGSMGGRFSSAWRPAGRWSCLTGMAQMSVVWQRLFRVTRERQYLDAARRVNGFLKRTHDLSSSNDGIRGGIKGSHPVNGPYGQYGLLNWAGKFFIDALILDLYPDIQDERFYHPG